MEIPLSLENKGAIAPLTTSPIVVDCTSFIGGYVRIATATDTDQMYVCGIPTSSAPTVHVADTSGETYYSTASDPHVADIVAGGTTGTHRFITEDNPYLWIRTVSGSFSAFIKPAGRPGLS